MSSAQLEVRSFRSVFALERRIYRIDTLRLNPSGVPLRGIAYGSALVVLSLLAKSLPGVGWVVGAVPWYISEIVLPCAGGALFAVTRIDGRPFHTAGRAALVHVMAARRVTGLARAGRNGKRHWVPGPIVFVADGSEPLPRALRYRGPGAVFVSFPHDRVEWRSGSRRRADIVLHPLDSAGERAHSSLEMGPGTVLEISPLPWRAARRARR
jgi:hypothetical protein